jgi:hypothetical protein
MKENIHNLLNDIVKTNSVYLGKKEINVSKKSEAQLALDDIKKDILKEAMKEEQIHNEQIEYTNRLKRTQMLIAEENYLKNINQQLADENKIIIPKPKKIQFEEAATQTIKVDVKKQKPGLIERFKKEKTIYVLTSLLAASLTFFYLQSNEIKPKKNPIKIITVKKPDMPVKQEEVRLYFIDEINDLIYKPIENLPEQAIIEKPKVKIVKTKKKEKPKPKINFDMNKNDL